MAENDDERAKTMAQESTPFLALLRGPEKEMILMIDVDEFSRPGAWGVALADIVQHLSAAYALRGVSSAQARVEILHGFEQQLSINRPQARRSDVN